MSRFFRSLFLTSPFFDADDKGGGAAGDDDAKAKAQADADTAAKQQEEQNKQFAERAKRAEEATKKKLFEELGVKDEAEYQAFLKNKKEAEDKQKTETQRLADEAKAAKDRADKLEAESKTERETLLKRVQDTEIKVSALAAVTDKDGKVIRPAFRADAIEEVLLLIQRGAITEKDGKYEGIEKALADLAKAKPHWLVTTVKEKPKGTPNERDRQGGSSASDKDREPLISRL